MQKLTNFILKRSGIIIVAALVLTILFGLISSNLTMDSNMSGMLSEDNEVVKGSQEFEDEFGAQDSVFIVVKGNDEKTIQGYVERLVKRINKEELAKNVLYKVDTDSIEKYAPLYIGKEKYEELENSLNNPESPVSKFVQNPGIRSMTDLFLFRLDNMEQDKREDFFNTFVNAVLKGDRNEINEQKKEEFLASMLFGRIGETGDTNEYLSSDSGNVYLIILKPNVNMENIMESRERFFAGIETAIEEIRASSQEYSSLKAGYTGGGFVQDYQGDREAFTDFFSMAVITLIAILLLIILSFRRLLLPLSSALPLVMAALITASFAYVVYGGLNIFSVGFAALMLGLGIDFAIHIISRYLEERSKGKSLETAISRTIKFTGVGMITGALTTAIAFLAFVFAEFKAFQQMGIISGVGILFGLVIMLTVVPAVIVQIDKRRSNKKFRDTKYAFLKYLALASRKFSWLILLMILVLGIVLWKNVSSVKIESSMKNIYPENMPSLEWLEVVEQEFDFNPESLSIMVNNIEELKKFSRDIKNLPNVEKVESVLDYMPEKQDYKLGVIDILKERLAEGMKSADWQMRGMDFEDPQTKAYISDSVKGFLQEMKTEAIRMGVDADSEGIDEIGTILDALDSEKAQQAIVNIIQSKDNLYEISHFEVDRMTINDLPEAVRANYVGKTGKLALEITPDRSMWEEGVISMLQKDISGIGGSKMVGMQVLIHEVVEMTKKDAARISLISLAIIFIILCFVLRSVKDAFIAITPVTVAIYFLLGALGLLGIELNIMNIVGFPLIIGIGVDSSIHILHRIRKEGIEKMEEVLIFTGKAVTMTTLTTVIGFGSFTFANHQGLASLGKLIVVGMLICLMLTLILIPSLYLTIMYCKEFIWKKVKKA